MSETFDVDCMLSLWLPARTLSAHLRPTSYFATLYSVFGSFVQPFHSCVGCTRGRVQRWFLFHPAISGIPSCCILRIHYRFRIVWCGILEFRPRPGNDETWLLFLLPFCDQEVYLSISCAIIYIDDVISGPSDAMLDRSTEIWMNELEWCWGSWTLCSYNMLLLFGANTCTA